MNSFNRISTANAYDSGLRNITQRHAALASLQDNLSSGKRVVRPSDDPSSAAQAERAITRMNRIATDQRALASQSNSIAMAEGTLGEVTDALRNFRTLVVSAGSGTFTQKDRETVALQLTGLRDQIVSLSNRKDTNGMPLFSALGSALAPFVGPSAQPQDYTFNGLPGQAASGVVSIPFALDGDSAFMLQPARDGVYNVSLGRANSNLQTNGVTLTDPSLVTGSSYTISNLQITAGTAPGTSQAHYDLTETLAGDTVAQPPVATVSADYVATGTTTTIPINLPGLTFNIVGAPVTGDSVTVQPNPSMFSILDDAIRDIGSATTDAAASQAVGQALGNLDITMDRVSAVRGLAGELLNRAERITDNLGERSLQLEGDRSRAEDMDMIKGLSDFDKQQAGFQAALQTYAQVQKLSLFNYIS